MRFLIFIILLLTAPITFAQDSTDSAIITNNSVEISATDSASPSADLDSSPTINTHSSDSSGSSQPEKQVIEPDTETIIIYTGIMILILLAFYAGKKSSEFKSDDN